MMKGRPVFLLPVVLVSLLAVILLYSRSASYARQRSTAESATTPPRSSADAPATATIPGDLVTLRVDFRSRSGPKGKVATRWDGRLRVSPGTLRNLHLWEEDPRDSYDGNAWTFTTRRGNPRNPQQRKRGHATQPLKDGSLVIELVDTVPETEVALETARGNFSFALKDVPWGVNKTFAGGLVQVCRMGNAATILSAPTEDDYPASAIGRDGQVYVTYVAFSHGKDFRRRDRLPQPPEDYEILAEPTGGDQVLLLRLHGDRWVGPVAVSAPGQDVYRTAIAVDGTGGVWIFWSANREGNWDLFCRQLKGDDWSKEFRLTTDAGPDTFPTATTDSDGRVWLAWQAFRNGTSDILAVRQEAEGFSSPMVVADSEANCWAPSIASASDGRVAVAWDSYEKGDYDVLCRVSSGGQFGEVIGIAQTRKAEMRPSVAFDIQGRLWVAYEEGPVSWGKDWGALEKTGVALYQERTVAVRVWSPAGLLRPTGDPAEAFSRGRRRPASSGSSEAKAEEKNPEAALLESVNASSGPRQKLALPRLCAGADGRMWLAVRTPRLGDRVGVGTTWFEHLAWYEGSQWSNEIVCPKTDNLLDNRPSLLAGAGGDLVLVASSDGRFATAGQFPAAFLRQQRKAGARIVERPLESPWPDPVNNELVMVRIGPVAAGPAEPATLKPAPAGGAAEPDPAAIQEAADVKRMRAVRANVGGKTLQILRGDFHRHTEISQDGGGDGMLMDMWRYAIDAAALDWVGNGDHDNGAGREYSWWTTQKTTDVFHIPRVFAPMFTYERSVSYPDGHRNVVFASRGIRTLPRLQGGQGKAMDDLGPDAPRPSSPDTQMLYTYLSYFDGVCASHTSGTNMGTDWRDNDPKVEPVVEIYQGCRQNYEMPGAPRSNTADNSIGGWRPLGFVSLALKKGYRLGFQSSSDHISTHISYCNVWAEGITRDAILAGLKARRVYGSTDNIIADVRCGEHFMGEEFTLRTKPKLTIHLTGTGPLAKVHVIKDGKYAHSAEPNQQDVQMEWIDFDPKPGQTSYYYVRGEQADGELVWVSPMWIRYQP